MLVAVTFPAVTVIGPGVSVVGAVAVIWVGELTVKFPVMPLKRTADAPVNPLPEIVTLTPDAIAVGVKLAMNGPTGPSVNDVALIAVPPWVVTVIGPGASGPAGTAAVICELESTVNAAAMPLKLTLETAEKFAPMMTTAMPGEIAVGENPLIVGDGVTRNDVELGTVTLDVDTRNTPDVAVGGSVTAIVLGDTTVNVTGAPFSVTPVTAEKFAPVSVTLEPAAPLAGEKPKITGVVDAVTVKLLAEVAVPFEV